MSNADPKIVWELMPDTQRWPDRPPDITEATLEGDFEEGTTHRWNSGQGTIISVIRETGPPEIIA